MNQALAQLQPGPLLSLVTSNLVYDPIVPIPAIVLTGLLLLLITIYAYWRVGLTLSVYRRIALLIFRLLGLALLLLLLLQPSREIQLPPPAKDRPIVVAVDSSLSMKQQDVERASRWDAAIRLLIDSETIGKNGSTENPLLSLFQFSSEAQPITKSVLELAPKGKTTKFNQSIEAMLMNTGARPPKAIILLTDGHDFEMVSPVKTGTAARTREAPIYAVPLGRQGKVRDVSARITSYQPYCYVRQKARIAATLRVIGCEYEDLQLELSRQGNVIQKKRVNAGELQEVPAEFEVIEPEIGQYEYEIRVLPLDHEVDSANNSAITYLNIVDQQIRILMLEGDPYWDSTFLQRSLMRNDKFDVHALLRYGNDRVRAICKTEGQQTITVPGDLETLSRYDVVILGRGIEKLMQGKESLLDAYVAERNGTLIFSRGKAFSTGSFKTDLEPVIWGESYKDHVRLGIGPDGRKLAAFRSLTPEGVGLDDLPELVISRSPEDAKPLMATLAVSTSGSVQTPMPAVVHRRHGRGQVVSVGVDGLWRWGLTIKAEAPNTPFDRFWDQLILWLMAGRDFTPTRQYTFRPNSANVLLGEKALFRATLRQPEPSLKSVPITLFQGDKECGRISLTPSSSDPGRFTGEFLPQAKGRYRAIARFPDGSTQESRFVVFDENLEETEVTTDTVALRRLCDSSGGRLIEPEELSKLIKELQAESRETTPKTRIEPVWNTGSVFYLAAFFFGLDWFLRRRWGLC